MKIEKVEKLLADLHDKTEYVLHIRNLKQALNHGLVSKKVPRVIQFNQNARLKPYIDMNADPKKSYFQKDFFKLMSNTIYGKSCYKVFHRTSVSNRNEKKKKKEKTKQTNKQKSL